MDEVPRLLMKLVLAILVIMAVFVAVTSVMDNQGEELSKNGDNVGKGLDCVFSDKENAQKCLETGSVGTSEGSSDG
ncbi:MAG: hypothetical protein ABEJ72_06830 [Candidatus Aenigmatarchaeota archaeon]